MNEAAASAAVDLDRAAIDLTAIGSGFLPRGAVMVSRAGSGDVDSILDEVDQGDRRDPLATVRLRFSIDLLVRASEDRQRAGPGGEAEGSRSRPPLRGHRGRTGGIQLQVGGAGGALTTHPSACTCTHPPSDAFHL